MDGWDVKASCATGYEGTAVVKMCSEPLTPYSLSGCGPSKCGMPTTEQMRDYEAPFFCSFIFSASSPFLCFPWRETVRETRQLPLVLLSETKATARLDISGGTTLHILGEVKKPQNSLRLPWMS